MFGQSNETPYDLRFTLWGIPVRVHPIFWLTAAFLSWIPDRLDLTFVGMLCVFFSIFIHEMGHALINKIYGWRSEIVLEFFGGYATTTQHSYWKNIAVCAAGPSAGLLLWGGCEILLILNDEGHIQISVLSIFTLLFMTFINFVWSMMNLVPVFPLDGGQIARNFLMWLIPRRGALYAVNLSILCAGGLAVWAVRCRQLGTGVFGLDPTFLGIMFGVLCYQSIQLRNVILHGGYYR